MTTAATLALFALAASVTVVTPGPTALLALANGSRHGLRGAAGGIAGALLSDVLLIAAVALGLGALLAASQTAFSVLKVVGALYLAWLGIGLLRSRALLPPGLLVDGADGGAAATEPAVLLFRRSLLVALGNPKGLLFFSALLPQFIDAAAPQAAQYATLGLAFVLIDGAAMLAYALVGARCVSRLGARGVTAVNRGCGAVLIALAGLLAFEPRRA